MESREGVNNGDRVDVRSMLDKLPRLFLDIDGVLLRRKHSGMFAPGLRPSWRSHQ